MTEIPLQLYPFRSQADRQAYNAYQRRRCPAPHRHRHHSLGGCCLRAHGREGGRLVGLKRGRRPKPRRVAHLVHLVHLVHCSAQA
eukprot:COSAG01_NODE_1197_length_11296_cov_113.645262_9_plen_85_part_00